MISSIFAKILIEKSTDPPPIFFRKKSGFSTCSNVCPEIIISLSETTEKEGEELQHNLNKISDTNVKVEKIDGPINYDNSNCIYFKFTLQF